MEIEDVNLPKSLDSRVTRTESDIHSLRGDVHRIEGGIGRIEDGIGALAAELRSDVKQNRPDVKWVVVTIISVLMLLLVFLGTILTLTVTPLSSADRDQAATSEKLALVVLDLVKNEASSRQLIVDTGKSMDSWQDHHSDAIKWNRINQTNVREDVSGLQKEMEMLRTWVGKIDSSGSRTWNTYTPASE
jgi:sensor domain CHASE-containing protein